jgi:hypothetical protein
MMVGDKEKAVELLKPLVEVPNNRRLIEGTPLSP